MTTKTKTNGNTKARNACLCGCGKRVRGYFAQGHDQRMRGFLLRAQAETATKAELAAVRNALKVGVILKHVAEANAPVLRARA